MWRCERQTLLCTCIYICVYLLMLRKVAMYILTVSISAFGSPLREEGETTRREFPACMNDNNSVAWEKCSPYAGTFI